MTDKEKRKGELIDSIIFQCKVNNVPDLDTVFIHLATLDLSGLINIAYELNIKVI